VAHSIVGWGEGIASAAGVGREVIESIFRYTRT
jgi:hypothetical protein